MKSNELLKQYLNRKQEFNPAYSLRAFARDLKVSPSYVSLVLSGKKKLSAKTLERAIAVLDLDDNAAMNLKRMMAAESPEGKMLLENSLEQGSRSSVQGYRPLPKGKISLLHRWYYVAVLDLMTCSGFRSDIDWISKRLGITLDEVREAIFALERLKLIQVTDGSWKKASPKVRIPTTQSQSEVREFHRQMIEMSLHELLKKSDQIAFEKRLISGVTFAANPKKLKKAMQLLNESIHHVADDLMKGECTEVYQLNFQLFPLSR
jgi:uncharacterized protein (TIGR02147 family)